MLFRSRLAGSGASAVVIDHFIGGDGTQDGSRTRRTRLPLAMKSFDSQALELSYREKIATIARNYLPVGISAPGFAGVIHPKWFQLLRKYSYGPYNSIRPQTRNYFP